MLNLEKLNKYKALKAEKPDLSSMAKTDTSVPVLEKREVTPEEEAQRLNENYMQTFDTWENASKKGSIAQRDWANAKVKQLQAQGKDVGEFLTLASMIGDTESPEDKAKREKREKLGEVFNTLGDVIGSAANLYYANKGGYSMDLGSVSDKHRERMAQIKAKQDSLKQKQDDLLMKARLGEIKAEREEKKAEKKAEAVSKENAVKFERDLVKMEIQDAYKKGIIDYQTASNMLRDAERLETNKAIEAYRQSNRLALAEVNHQNIMKREDERSGGSRVTVRVPKQGGGYTEYRKNDLNDERVISMIYNQLPEMYKKKRYPSKFDMNAAIGKAMADGVIEELSEDIKVNTSDGKKKTNKSSSLLPTDEGNKKTSLLP